MGFLFVRDVFLPVMGELSFVYLPCIALISTRFPRIAALLSSLDEWEDNPDYFEAIPKRVLQQRLNEEILDRRILEKYQTALNGRRKSVAGEEVRELSGLETYKMEANKEYLKRFGEDTLILTRLRKRERRRTSSSASQSQLSIAQLESHL